MFDHRPPPIGGRANDHLTLLCGCARAAARDVRGVAAIEFAMIVPVLLFMMVAIVDFGLAIYSDMEVQNAAQAGAQYAIAHGFNANSISQAVTSATNLAGIAVSSGPTKFCGCPSSIGVTNTACNSTCSGGSTPGTYVTVSARGTYTTIVPYPLIPNSFTFTSPSTVRIQ
jgi:Flp pilus assembly protein TadG